ncbi:uncharacterized protein LOC126560920 [Anopheles maculipalpis]|uniref:uncharacterized protein LOC126560920 n=1 Tax=Anopheles maculipalpis TaxID=1496333 RepID=UPI002158A2F3|nr:uncharacterized protein LOC126560920 [Anopheles maculipalpis]
MAQTSGFVGVPSTPYTVIRAWNVRRWSTNTVDKKASGCTLRTLNQSASQHSLKSLPSVKSSKSVEKATNPSILQTIQSIQWSNYKSRLTPDNLMQFARNLPAHTATAYNVVINSREYELAQSAIVKACQLSVQVAKTAYLWLGLFLESREYYYFRYYTLLLLEYTVQWLRYGLRSTFDLIRRWMAKSEP